MKLMYRIALRLAMVLLPLMAVWAALFYFKTLDEINDETDDALDEFSDIVISRVLSGREMPSNIGANILYDIIPIGRQFAQDHPSIRYYFNDEYFPSIGKEPARVLTTVFMTDGGEYFLLKAYTPTIDKEELMQGTLVWVVILYFALLITVIMVTEAALPSAGMAGPLQGGRPESSSGQSYRDLGIPEAQCGGREGSGPL